MSVHITLTPELEQYVKDKVKSGGYATPSEVIRECVRMRMESEVRRQEMNRMIDEGSASRSIPGDQAVSEMKAWTASRKKERSAFKSKRAA